MDRERDRERDKAIVEGRRGNAIPLPARYLSRRKGGTREGEGETKERRGGREGELGPEGGGAVVYTYGGGVHRPVPWIRTCARCQTSQRSMSVCVCMRMRRI
jgi:hypothetical protein